MVWLALPMVSEYDFVDVAVSAPVARIVKLNVPGAVGVPDSTPPDDSDKPPGSDPVSSVNV